MSHAASASAMLRRVSSDLALAPLPWPATVYLLCVVTPFWFHVGSLYLSLLRLFLVIMFIPLLVRLLSGRYGRLIATDILFILHVLWMGVTMAVNTPSQAVTQLGSVGVEFLGGYLVARAYIQSAEAFIALCRTLVIICLCLLPLALFESFTGRVPAMEIIDALPFGESAGIAVSQPRLGFFRVQGVFVHPIHFGLFCSVIFSLAFVALKDVIPTGRRWLYSALIALTCLLSLSSGAILAIALQFGMILWAAVFNRVQFRWWLLVGLFAIAYVVVDIISNKTAIEVFMARATFSAQSAWVRAIIFHEGMQNVWAHPILGLGLNDWARPAWLPPSVDNFWLVIAMRHGIPGFLLLVAGYVAVLFGVMRRDFSADPVLANIRRAWVFTFLGLSFTLVTVHVWTSIYSFTFFMFGAGVWLMTVSTAQPAAIRPASGGSAGRDVQPAQANGTARTGPRYSRYQPVKRRDRVTTEGD
jgi:O-antigen ligase